ncbi:MAG: c-type cytochrome domain-containing protein [Verrucomicrobiota bacterium]|nr:c-type cytochrome domain-containing protein [Verrucomicrobiota bacterium]
MAPEDAVLDEPEVGSYSSGFLARSIDHKMAQLRTTTNSFFLGISSQSFKFVGDICLLVVAVIWLGTSVWDEFKGQEEGGEGDVVETAEAAKKEAESASKDAANAAIFAKTIKPLLKERCYDCHEGKDAKPKSDPLDLTIFEDDDGAGIKGLASTIKKGNAGGSELLKRIKDSNDPMPPKDKGEMFSPEQAKEVEDWINGGANMPEAAIDSEKIVSIVTMLFKGILPIAFILILHYLTGVLFNAGDSLIKSTPSRLSASGLLKAMALVMLLAGFAAATAGIVYGIIDATKGFSDNWLKVLTKIGGGVLVYLFCASLARLWLKPAQLNIKIGAGNTAGDEALGIMALFSKTMLKVAPIIYGMALIFCLLFAAMNLVAKDDIPIIAEPATTTVDEPKEGILESVANISKETLEDVVMFFKDSPLEVAAKYLDKGSVLMMAIKIPVYLFAYFLFSYVLVEALRALFSLPSRRS